MALQSPIPNGRVTGHIRANLPAAQRSILNPPQRETQVQLGQYAAAACSGASPTCIPMQCMNDIDLLTEPVLLSKLAHRLRPRETLFESIIPAPFLPFSQIVLVPRQVLHFSIL